MLAVSSAFPLTSDQPPLAVVSPKALAALISGGDRAAAQRFGSDRIDGAARPENAVKSASPGGAIAAARNPFAVAGPPPSFEANILEIERQFEAILARIELARSQREMRQGSQVTAPVGKSSSDAADLKSAEILRFDLGELRSRTAPRELAELDNTEPQIAPWADPPQTVDDPAPTPIA